MYSFQQIGIASSYVLWALSKTFALFVLARIVGGISKGNVSLSMAVIADVSSLSTRGRGMVSYFVFCFVSVLRTDVSSHKNKVFVHEQNHASMGKLLTLIHKIQHDITLDKKIIFTCHTNYSR